MNKIWLARDKDERLFLYTNEEPSKDNIIGIWVCCGLKNQPLSKGFAELDKHLFPEVQWSDAEPTKVKLEIVK